MEFKRNIFSILFVPSQTTPIQWPINKGPNQINCLKNS